MYTQAALFYCISFLASKAWTKNCSGKLIAKNICIPNEYTNQVSESSPNSEEVVVSLARVILLDINPKDKTISVHIDINMVWVDNRIDLQNYNSSERFGTDVSDNLWIPNYRIRGYVTVFFMHTYISIMHLLRDFFHLQFDKSQSISYTWI